MAQPSVAAEVNAVDAVPPPSRAISSSADDGRSLRHRSVAKLSAEEPDAEEPACPICGGLGSATTLVYPTPVFQLFILGQLHTTASVRVTTQVARRVREDRQIEPHEHRVVVVGRGRCRRSLRPPNRSCPLPPRRRPTSMRTGVASGMDPSSYIPVYPAFKTFDRAHPKAPGPRCKQNGHPS